MTDLTASPGARRSRGVQRLWDPRVWGTIIGAVGATVFVLSNREALPAPVPTVATLAWTAALLLYVTFVFAAPRETGLVLGWHWDERAGAGSAVIAGLVMLALIALDAARPTRPRAVPVPAPGE